MAPLTYASFADLKIRVDPKHLPDDAIDLAVRVRADWAKDKLRTKIFSDGISNALIGVYEVGYKDDMVLVRIYGDNTEKFIDRKAELSNMKLFYDNGCGPTIYASFANGIAYSFIPGDMLDTDSVRDPKMYPLVAAMMAKMHKMNPSSEDEDWKPCMFDRMRTYLALGPDGPNGFDCDKTRERAEELRMMDRATLMAEVDEMDKKLSGCDSPVVFTHHDLLLANIVIVKDDVRFIDYEYGGYNYQVFDIANHFAEFAGMGSPLDYDGLYPDEAFQKMWICSYLAAYRDTSVSAIPESDVNTTYVLVNKFTLCAHLMWGLWALMQAKLSAIDFDFIEYGKTRLDEYFRRKKEFLSLTV
jgi:ethanolamine kinase